MESGDALREQIVAVFSDAGYEVSTDYREGMKAVLTFDPDAVVLGADPPQLDCCDLPSEIKGSEHTHNIRVVMLSPGGSAERTRGLDLGADDVLSLPFYSHELLSRVRSQLRNKSVADELRGRLRLAEENRNTTQQVVAAVNEERRTLRLARDDDPEPIHLEETDTSFAIGWKVHYHIAGTAFTYTDNDTGRVTTILGYPTQKIAQVG